MAIRLLPPRYLATKSKHYIYGYVAHLNNAERPKLRQEDQSDQEENQSDQEENQDELELDAVAYVPIFMSI